MKICVKRKDLIFYLVAFLALVLPYLNIVYFGIWVANRYVYFSAVCVVVIVSRIIIDAVSKKKRTIRYLCFVCGIAYVVLNLCQTWRYQKVWKDDHTIWNYETSLEKPSLMAYSALADALIAKARSTESLQQKRGLYQQAAMAIEDGLKSFHNSKLRETTPHLFMLYFLQGSLAEHRGESYQKQLSFYSKAFELKPKEKATVRKMAEVHYRMAVDTNDPKKREKLATRSLDYFKKYIHLTRYDKSAYRSNLLLLEAYEEHFPFMRLQIQKIKVSIKENS